MSDEDWTAAVSVAHAQYEKYVEAGIALTPDERCIALDDAIQCAFREISMRKANRRKPTK